MIQCPGPKTWAAAVLLAVQMLAPLAGAAETSRSAPAAESRPGFRVYDALLFRNKPDLSKFGLVLASGSGNLWSPHASMDRPDAEGVRRELARWHDFTGPFYIDIEHWRVYDIPDRDIDANIAKLGQVADIVRQTAPGLQFGFYAVLPENVYWPLVAGTANQLQHWRDSARRTGVLAQKVNFIMPSLYTFYDSESDRAGWEKWARITLTEARRYGKPVYPFLWPQFHESNEKLKGHTVPGDYWRMELEICRRYADGIMLWGGGGTNWDENAEWWQETKKFLATLKQP